MLATHRDGRCSLRNPATNRWHPHPGLVHSNGTPNRIRTCDPSLRRRLLYPTELSGQNRRKPSAQSVNLAAGQLPMGDPGSGVRAQPIHAALTPRRLLPTLLALPAVGVAQLVRAPDCDSGGRGFNSRRPPHYFPATPTTPHERAAIFARAPPQYSFRCCGEKRVRRLARIGRRWAVLLVSN